MDTEQQNNAPTALRVLLVEDNPDEALLVRRSLERGGFLPDVRVVDNARDYCAALASPPDIVISDFHQPDFDALRALTLLRERGLDTPFIVVSGSLDDASAAETLRRGAADYLLKDRLARLPSAVQAVLTRNRLRHEKQAAEDALVRSERVFRALIEHGGSPVSLLSRDGLNLYVAPAMLRVTGFDADERLSRSCFDLVHPDHIAEVRSALSSAAAQPGATASVEFPLRRRDGSWRWVNVHYTNLLDDPDVGAIVANARDITERVERERALRESETRLRHVIDASRDGYWEWTLSDNTMDWSERFYRMLGLPPGNPPASLDLLHDLLHEDDRGNVDRCLESLLDGAPGFETELRLRAADGGYRLTNLRGKLLEGGDGRPERVVGMVSDVTTQRHAVAHIRRLNSFYAALAGVSEAVVRIQDETKLLHEVCRITVESGGLLLAWVGRIDEASGKVVPVAGFGPAADQLDKVDVSIDASLPSGRGPTGIALREGRVYICNDWRADERAAWWHGTFGDVGVGSMASLPLRVEGRVIGGLMVYATEKKFFDEELVRLHERLADSVAYALQALTRERLRGLAAAELRDSEEKFRQLAGSIPEVFWISEPDLSAYLYISPAFERIFGLPPDAVFAQPQLWSSTVLPVDVEPLERALAGAAQTGFDVEYRIRRPDGSVRWLHEQAFPVKNKLGEVYRLAGLTADVTERKRMEEQLLQLAHYDVLTGLPNRVLLHDRLQQSLALARRNGWHLGVLVLDVDRFKLVNDSFGHAAGDELVCQVGRRLAACMRAGDTVARLGGDEFAVVLNELAQSADAEVVCRKVLRAFAEPFEVSGREVFITPSIGATLCPEDGESAEDLLRNADIAMYRAKELGGSGYQFFIRDLNRYPEERMKLETDLRRALGRDEFVLHYQPRVRACNSEVTVVEALIRWQHPQRGMVTPGEFIPLMEETGLIIDAGEWVLREACAEAQRWRESGSEAVVAVNISARQFESGRLESTVREALEATGLPGERLELELTESYLMRDAVRTIETLRRLKALGVRLAVDDFGTGYSSMAYLKQFPLNALKIDRSFVNGIASDPDDAQIVRAIIDMAHGLRLEVIAEGVETAAQYDFLATHGCDELQGYLIARPMDAQSLAAMLAQGRLRHLPEEKSAAVRTVLAVDDEADILELLAHSLARDGYRVLTATDPAEAFNLLAQHEVGVVLSDERMPGMRGVEFLGQVKELYPDCVRILASAHADTDRLVEAVNLAGVFKFVPKPWKRDTLHAAVREAFWIRDQARTVRRARAPRKLHVV